MSPLYMWAATVCEAPSPTMFGIRPEMLPVSASMKVSPYAGFSLVAAWSTALSASPPQPARPSARTSASRASGAPRFTLPRRRRWRGGRGRGGCRRRRARRGGRRRRRLAHDGAAPPTAQERQAERREGEDDRDRARDLGERSEERRVGKEGSTRGSRT